MKLKLSALALVAMGLSPPTWAAYDCGNLSAVLNATSFDFEAPGSCIGLSDAPTTRLVDVNAWLGTSFTLEYKDDYPASGGGTNNSLFDLVQGAGDAFTMTFSQPYSGQRLVVGLKFGGAGNASVGYFDFGSQTFATGTQIHWSWDPSFRGDGISHASVFATAPIPEPGTYAMLLAGLAGLGFVARRRQAG